MAPTMIDFDESDDWFPNLSEVLRAFVTENAKHAIAAALPSYEFIDDARDLLWTLADRDPMIDATIQWISNNKIAGYHGTRLTADELESIKAKGLIPLKARERRFRLARALSGYSRWHEIADKLDAQLQAYGAEGLAGRRENQTHLTLSRGGLTQGFNHYLTYGSEFDQRVASSLLDQAGLDLLAVDGSAVVIKVAVPGDQALAAAHPFLSIDDVRARGDVPNIVDVFLLSWSYKLADRSFQPRSLKTDCGMIFRETIPPNWIVEFQPFA